jgi:hypothetical protein
VLEVSIRLNNCSDSVELLLLLSCIKNTWLLCTNQLLGSLYIIHFNNHMICCCLFRYKEQINLNKSVLINNKADAKRRLTN